MTPRSSLPAWSCLRAGPEEAGPQRLPPPNPRNQVGAGSYRLERMRRSLAPLKPKPAPALGMDV